MTWSVLTGFIIIKYMVLTIKMNYYVLIICYYNYMLKVAGVDTILCAYGDNTRLTASGLRESILRTSTASSTSGMRTTCQTHTHTPYHM